MRLYDTLAVNAGELSDLAAELGGARGEALMDECAAKVGGEGEGVRLSGRGRGAGRGGRQQGCVMQRSREALSLRSRDICG